MTSQFITRNEVEDLSEAELRSKFTALISDLMRANGERARYPLPRYRTPGC